MNAANPKVFISYRREDTSGHAGRLYDAMTATFGEGNVFVDVDLAPGVDFVERIKDAIGDCRVLLVMIGPRWAVISGDEQQPRLADPEDFVRLEVETALRRAEVTVIPVLVAGAQMPDPDDLPEGLRELTHRNAIELSDGRWRYDVGRLNAVLDDLLADTSAIHETPTSTLALPTPARMPSTARIVIDGMLIAGLAALLGRWVAAPISPSGLETDAAQIATAVLRRTVTWALLGAALGGWLSFVHGETGRLAPRILLGLAFGALAGAVGGLLIFAPQYLTEPSKATIDALSVGGYAVSGLLVGILLGVLWIPRNVAAGALAGLVAGALVRLVWSQAIEWATRSPLQEAFQVGIQCLLIVGLVLGVLQMLSVRSPSAVQPAR